MATRPERPHGNANFLVELGRGGGGRSPGAGFAEVIFPPFTLPAGAARSAATTDAPAGTADSVTRHLVLRRGATGALDLYAWWDLARHGKAPRRRVVTVKLLAGDGATVVMSWRFLNVRPVSLAYSPLCALDGGVLMETIELAFDAVEMV